MSKKANKVINNTIILYIKMIFSVIIGFFTVRIILNALGEIDYGIYTLVGGIVAALSFLNSVMSHSTSRFLSISLGKEGNSDINDTFHASIYVHKWLGFIVIVISEIGGWVLFNYFLNIPSNRIFSAQFVFQIMIINSFITIISVPYDSLIMSHEDFIPLSIIDISSLMLLLLSSLFLINFSGDRLILYGLLFFLVTFSSRMAKQIFTRKKYKHILVKSEVNRTVIKNMLSYSGWLFFGVLSSIASGEFSTILLNMFFGVKIISANGIASQVRNQINNFAVNMTKAILPQLNKSEGGGEREKMLELTGISTKFSIYMFSFIAIPVIFENQILLKLWLKNVPDYTSVFCQIFLIGLLIDKFTFHLGDAIRAVGDIKWYQIVESITIVINLPISFLLFKNNYPPQTLYIVPLFLSVFLMTVRFYFAHNIAGLNIKKYFLEIILKALIPALMSILFLLIIMFLFDESFYRVILSFLISTIILITIIFNYGLSKNEKEVIRNYRMQLTQRIRYENRF